jgi:hypothetical protein
VGRRAKGEQEVAKDLKAGGHWGKRKLWSTVEHMSCPRDTTVTSAHSSPAGRLSDDQKFYFFKQHWECGIVFEFPQLKTLGFHFKLDEFNYGIS